LLRYSIEEFFRLLKKTERSLRLVGDLAPTPRRAVPLITGGAGEKTSIVMNCFQHHSKALPFSYRNLFKIDATAIAEGLNLKTTSFSIVNTAMVGAFAGASGLLEIHRLVNIIRDLVPIKKEENAAAARQAFQTVQEISDG